MERISLSSYQPIKRRYSKKKTRSNKRKARPKLDLRALFQLFTARERQRLKNEEKKREREKRDASRKWRGIDLLSTGRFTQSFGG